MKWEAMLGFSFPMVACVHATEVGKELDVQWPLGLGRERIESAASARGSTGVWHCSLSLSLF